MAVPPLEIKVTADTGAAEAGLKRVGVATQRVGQQAQASTHGIRNVALQLSQVGQQAAATGNVMQAVAIQLPDMMAGFGGLAPAIAGAALGLGAALLPQLLATKDTTEDTTDALEDMGDQMDRFLGLVERGQTPLAELVSKFGQFADEIQRAQGVAASAALTDAMTALDGAVDVVGGALSAFAAAQDQFGVALQKQAELGEKTAENAMSFAQIDKIMGDTAGRMREAADDMGLTINQANALRKALDALAGAEGPEAIAAAASDALDVINGMDFALGRMPAQITPIVSHLNMVLEAAASGNVAIQDMGDSASGAASSTALIASNLTTAAQQAALLADEMEAIDRFERAGASLQAMDQYGDFAAYQESRLKAPDEPVKRIESQARQSARAIRDAFDDADAFGGMFDDLDRIEARTGEAFDSMVNNFQSGTDKMARIGQAFAATETLVNAWRAYSQTIADPSLPWFAKFSAGASVLAAGLNAVNAVKSIGSGGTGGGGGGAAPAAAASAPIAPLDVRVQGLGANDLISGAALSDLFDRLQDEAGDRGLSVSFAT
jgi:hypothetical protein